MYSYLNSDLGEARQAIRLRRVGSPLRVITSSRASKPVPEVEKDDSGRFRSTVSDFRVTGWWCWSVVNLHGSRKFCQRGPTLTTFCVDEGREEPKTTKSGSLSARQLNAQSPPLDPHMSCWCCQWWISNIFPRQSVRDQASSPFLTN